MELSNLLRKNMYKHAETFIIRFLKNVNMTQDYAHYRIQHHVANLSEGKKSKPLDRYELNLLGKTEQPTKEELAELYKRYHDGMP